MKHTFLVLLFLISTGALVNAQGLKGSSWLLKSIDNIETSKSQAIEQNTKVTLTFDSDTTYSGKVCNSYNGKYSSPNGKSLTMHKANAPSVATCLGLGALETQVLDLYLKALRYRVDGEKLFIFTSDDRRLIFHKK